MATSEMDYMNRGGAIDYSKLDAQYVSSLGTSGSKSFASAHKAIMVIFHGNDSIYTYGRLNSQQADIHQEETGKTYAVWENTPANATFTVTSMTWNLNFITID